VFIGTSSQIQNDLISAVAEVMDSGVKERFVKFEDVTGKKRAEDVAAMALGFLEEHGCMGKLVAQCYDGAAVMASGLNGVQAKKDALNDLFDYIVEHHEEFDDAAILSADGYLSNLGNFDRGIVFDQIYDETVQDTGLPTGRRAHGDSRSHYKKLHNSILENILNQVQNRFKITKNCHSFLFWTLNSSPALTATSLKLAFASLTESYGPHFDLSRLKTELSV
ncbi:hypothetical protein JOQ06_011235, partial [Pogonophryne albipinna]